MLKIKVEGEDDGDNECYIQYWYNSESDCNLKNKIKVESETSLGLYRDTKFVDFRIKTDEDNIQDIKFPSQSTDCFLIKSEEDGISNVKVQADRRDEIAVLQEKIDYKTETSPAPDFKPKNEINTEPGNDGDDVQFVDWRLKTEETEEVHLSDVEFPETEDSGYAIGPAQKFGKPVDLSSKSFQCAACLSNFRNKKILTRHISNLCFKGEFPLCVIEKHFKCEQCQKLCSSRYQFKNHKLAHSGVKTRQLTDKTDYADNSCLNSHLRWHTGVKPHGCKHCAKKFFAAGDLRSHELSHTCEKLISCEICAQLFTTKRKVKSHMLLHGSETPYECKECGKKFKKKTYLQQHSKWHSGDRTAACQVCKKVYIKCHLGAHMRMHTGLNLHACQKCDKKFPFKGQLEKHEWTHAAVKPFACEMCPVRYASKQRLKFHISRHLGHGSMKFASSWRLRAHVDKWHVGVKQ